MAEQLEGYEFKYGPRKTKHPWDEWLNGKPWRLKRGVDFGDMDAQNLGNSARNYAKRHGLMVRTRVEDQDTIVIQAYKPGGSDE